MLAISTLLSSTLIKLKAHDNLLKYARVLLGHCPKPTTRLFIDYYTGQFRSKENIKTLEEKPPAAGRGGGGAVQNLAALLPLPYINPSTPSAGKSTISQAQVATEDKPIESPPDYEIPKPRTAFSSFVDHPQEFINFLEALIKHTDLKEEDKIDLYTTLFEMYLDTASRKKDLSEKQEWEGKAKKLIQGKDVRPQVSRFSLSVLTII